MIKKLITDNIWPLLMLREWVIAFACWLEKRFPYSDQFSFEAPYKYLSLHIIFRLIQKIIFYNLKTNIPKHTVNQLKEYLKDQQLIVCPTHTFVIESICIHELFGKAKQPFFLMIAREFFDLVLGLAEFPLKSAGCFSVARGSEGAKKSLKFATEIITTSKRPLVMFPEGESSLNLKALLPLKKGIALLAKETSLLDKPVSILPVGFRFFFKKKTETINNFLVIIGELENKLKIKNKPDTYQQRILNLLDYLINSKLNEFGTSSSESLISKSKLLCIVIQKYLSEKYNISSSEERSYEVAIKKSPKPNQEDLNLVYTWIEIKALTTYIPAPDETQLAIWAALLLKLIRVISNDYSNVPINKVCKGLVIKPILGKPIPAQTFKNLSIEESLDLIRDELEKLI